MTNGDWIDNFEQRFEAIHGMTIEEWNAKLEVNFKAKTGMTPDEWVVNKYKTITPIDLIKEYNEEISEDDIKLIKELQEIGLDNGVINVLLEYVTVVNGIGFVHPLVLEMGKNWFSENIITIEKAVEYMREEQRKNKKMKNKL